MRGRWNAGWSWTGHSFGWVGVLWSDRGRETPHLRNSGACTRRAKMTDYVPLSDSLSSKLLEDEYNDQK